MGDNLNGIFANMIQGMGFIGCAPNRVYNMAPPNGGGVEATAEGTELILHSAAAPLTALTLYGKSEQETTTGAQLLDVSQLNLPNTLNGVTATLQDDGGIKLEGTTGEGQYAVFSKALQKEEYQILTNPGYVTSFVNDINENIYILFRVRKKISSGETEKIFSLTTTTKDTRKFSGEDYDEIQIGIQVNPNTTVNKVFYPVVNYGNDTVQFEKYTGGLPSPSPGYPQAINSAGDSGTINVSLSDGGSQSQTLPVQTPNGLPGIPVSSGGNYTDANGQQWVCDEVDFKRGVYVQRIKKTSNITWIPHNGYTIEDSELFKAVNITDGLQRGISANQELSSKLIKDITILNYNKSGFCQSYGSIFARIKGVSELDEFKQLMADAEFLYCLETPIETPLSASDLAAYSALRTYSPTTVVSNDAGAWMRVGYKATPQPMTMMARKR